MTSGPVDELIFGLTSDSREVERGGVFFALRGDQTDGARFIPEALRRGASCIVTTQPLDRIIASERPAVCIVSAPEILEFMAEMAQWFYGTRSSPLVTIGITGTNGKTTMASMINHALKADGRKTVLIGTIGQEVAGRSYATDFTTPPSYVIHRRMREGIDDGAEFMVMEVSSHGLKYRRVDGIEFQVAVFSNLTHEHGEIHPDMDDYFRTKARLFDLLKLGGVGFVNTDDEYGRRLVKEYRGIGTLFDYGRDASSVRVVSTAIDRGSGRQIVELAIGEDHVQVDSILPGEYNAYNLAAAAGVLSHLGWDAQKAARLLSSFPGVDGRFNRYRVGEFHAVVDFAHTPDGLTKLLETVRTLTRSGARVITVFGCPGSRDASKRPVMGRVSSELSDHVIVTTDDIHYERPEDIVEDIVSGIPGENYEAILDRREAIRKALECGQSGDWIVVAGRGHERFQYEKDRKIPFVDGEILCEEANRLGLKAARL